MRLSRQAQRKNICRAKIAHQPITGVASSKEVDTSTDWTRPPAEPKMILKGRSRLKRVPIRVSCFFTSISFRTLRLAPPHCKSRENHLPSAFYFCLFLSQKEMSVTCHASSSSAAFNNRTTEPARESTTSCRPTARLVFIATSTAWKCSPKWSAFR